MLFIGHLSKRTYLTLIYMLLSGDCISEEEDEKASSESISSDEDSS